MRRPGLECRVERGRAAVSRALAVPEVRRLGPRPALGPPPFLFFFACAGGEYGRLVAMSGYVPLWRKIYEPDHWLAPTKRDPSCRRDAWMDLCQMAAHRPRTIAVTGSDDVSLFRGELVASLRTLGKRWRWSKDRVKRFMSDLEVRTATATVSETPIGTIYRIVNYDTYATAQPSRRDSERDTKRDRTETGPRQEQEGKEKPITTYTSDFEQIWHLHRRGSKRQAFAEYRKAVRNGTDRETITAGLESYVRSLRPDFSGAHLFRWIRDERWEEHSARRAGNTMTREELDIWEA